MRILISETGFGFCEMRFHFDAVSEVICAERWVDFVIREVTLSATVFFTSVPFIFIIIFIPQHIYKNMKPPRAKLC